MSTEIYKNIPQEMRSKPHWILWKKEKNKKGKDTKVPYQVNGIPMKPNNPGTWYSYDDVIDKIKGYSGIGFNFLGSGYIGIDFDNKADQVLQIKEGNFNNEIGEIIKTLNSYTEISQSGTGIHIIAKGELPGSDFKKGDYEMYGGKAGRYFVMTGDVIPGYETICDITDTVIPFYEKYNAKLEVKRPVRGEDTTLIPVELTSGEGVKLSDEEIISKACNSRNGETFRKLYYIGASDNDDHSSLDMSLCNILAFWTGKDNYQMDRLFRESALYRPEKWNKKHSSDGRTYGEMTIDEAIEGCSEVYDPKARFNKAERIQGVPIIAKDCYYRVVEKLGEETYIPISNFIINVQKIIKIPEENKYQFRCHLTNTAGKTIERDISDYDLNNVQRFTDAIESMAMSFTGTPKDLQFIKLFINDQKATEAVGLNTMGFRYYKNSWIYMDSEGILGETNETEFIFSGKDEIRNNLSRKNPISPEEAQELIPKMFNINSISITSTLIAHCCAFFLKARLKAHKIKFPNLFISGEAGSGKSQTVENLILPLLGYESDLKNASSITAYSAQMYQDTNNTIPLIIDEYKPFIIKDHRKIGLISELMRNTYESNSSSRGLPNSRGKQEKLTHHAPLVIIGEASTGEKANRERTIFLNFSRDITFSDKNFKDSLDYLRKPQIQNLLGKLGRSLVSLCLSLTDEDVMEMYRKSTDLVNDIQMARNKQNTAVIICGLMLLDRLLHEKNVAFDIMSAIKRITDYVSHDEEESNVKLSEIDEMFNIMDSYLMSNPHFAVGSYPGVKIKDEYIFIRLRELYERCKEHLRKTDTYNEFIMLPFNDFKKQIKSKPYYHSSNQTVAYISSTGGISYKAEKFKMEVMEVSGINLDGFRNCDEYLQKYDPA